MEACHALCQDCAESFRGFESRLNWADSIPWKFREWETSEAIKQDCICCSFFTKLKHEKNGCCDGASHKPFSVWLKRFPTADFVRVPDKKPLYLEFRWSCGKSLWYFFEDYEKNRLKGTAGFAYEVKSKLDETDWNAIRQWVDGCLQRHQSDCTCQDPFDVPGFEVIDCKTRKLVPWDKESGFAALSYVWGSAQSEKSLAGESSQTQLDRTILPNAVEKVIEDALACTYKLNIPYLWVDRYCINQTPTTHAEKDTKQHLIQNMDKIYSAAKVTIINVSGNDASSGLPGVSGTLRVSSPRKLVIGSQTLVPVINPKSDISSSKWAKRGWTLQEGLLARRRLVFTDTRILFQCTQSHHVEGLFGEFHSYEMREHEPDFHPRLATRVFPTSVVGSDSSSFSMAKVCNEFTSRDLTSDKDALGACMGVFSRLLASKRPEYQYCGLPFQEKSDASFALSLLWGANFDQFQGGPEHDPLSFRRAWGPSWSWLAWRGDMGFRRTRRIRRNKEWRDSGQSSLCVDIKLPRCHGKQTVMSTVVDYAKDIDQDGLYQNWLPYLRLSGWIATLRFEHGYDHRKSFNGYTKCYVATEQDEVGSGHILTSSWAKALIDDKAFNSSRRLDVIFIADDGWCKICLVIRRVVDEKPNAYERLGTCEVYYDSHEVKQVQSRSYITLKATRCPDMKRWDLECRYDTITLV